MYSSEMGPDCSSDAGKTSMARPFIKERAGFIDSMGYKSQSATFKVFDSFFLTIATDLAINWLTN